MPVHLHISQNSFGRTQVNYYIRSVYGKMIKPGLLQGMWVYWQVFMMTAHEVTSWGTTQVIMGMNLDITYYSASLYKSAYVISQQSVTKMNKCVRNFNTYYWYQFSNQTLDDFLPQGKQQSSDYKTGYIG